MHRVPSSSLVRTPAFQAGNASSNLVGTTIQTTWSHRISAIPGESRDLAADEKKATWRGNLNVRLRLILDIVAPVGGFHFVDAAPVGGRHWLR